jgi:hypothetical protein
LGVLDREKEREEVGGQTMYCMSSEKGIAVPRLDWVLIKRVFATDSPAPQHKGWLRGCQQSIYRTLVSREWIRHKSCWSQVAPRGGVMLKGGLLTNVRTP